MASAKRIYLDWSATAPVAPEAVAAMTRALGRWANPSSIHADGRSARAALEAARERFAAMLGCRADAVIFTGGGTEALALALQGTGAKRCLVSAIEHSAVHAAVPEAEQIGVTADGLLDLAALEAALSASGEDVLVTVMHANNETGTLQPIEEIAALCRQFGASLLVDAAQTVGKLPLPQADYVAITAHKFGGPPGVGALIAPCLTGLNAIQKGGGQERGLRGGTENLPAIEAMVAALEARQEDTDWAARAGALRDQMEQSLKAAGAVVIGEAAPRIPTLSLVQMPGVSAAVQLIQFDMAGISVSSGSACSSGKVGESHVLTAMGVAADAASEVIRVSLGWTTRAADIERFADVWAQIAERKAGAA